jgi:hypothetical protein
MPDYVHGSKRAQVQFATFFEEYLLLSSTGLCRLRRGSVIAFRTLGVLPIDAIEEHGQFGGTQGHACLAIGCGREMKSAFFESLEARITLSSY